METKAAFEVPRAQKNPTTNGTKAPLVRKSEAIHEMVNTD